MANSRKKGGRCIAGIESDSRRWVRLVNPGGAELTVGDYQYEDGTLPKVLDIVEVHVKSKEPLYYQPENWIIDNGYYFERKNIAKIGTRSDFNVLEHVCKCFTPFQNTLL